MRKLVGQHPAALWVLAFGRAWDTFSYFGTQTILVLYLTHVFGMGRDESYLLYGAYAAFSYMLPIVGGVIADRWIDSRWVLLLGSLLQISGNVLLMLPMRYGLSLGLAMTLVGTGLYKGNSSQLVGALYRQGDVKKESGFALLYFAINVGGALGPLIFGLVVYRFGWYYGFLCSALGVCIGVLCLLRHWHLLPAAKQHKPLAVRHFHFFGVALMSFCLLLSVAFYWLVALNMLLWLAFVIGFLYLAVTIYQQEHVLRQRLWIVPMLGLFSMCYYAIGLQTGITITLFIQQKIQQGNIALSLPASTFNALYCLFVLLLTPLSILFWRQLRLYGVVLSALHRLAMGLLLAAFGMAAFAVAANTSWILSGILTGYLLLSAGEVVLTPAVYTAISDSSPEHLKSTMMGAWTLFVGLGGYLSSVLADMANWIAARTDFSSVYFGEFLFIMMVALVAATACMTLAIAKTGK